MGKASRTIWIENQKKEIHNIYYLVLKHGYNIKVHKREKDGSYHLYTQGVNTTKQHWTEDWQFHELPHFVEIPHVLRPGVSEEELWILM